MGYLRVFGTGAYEDCWSLSGTGLESNSTVKVVNEGAFSRCFGLPSTGLSENTTVTTIEPWVFADCTTLTSTGLENNSTVKEISTDAFTRCTGLTSTGLEKNTTINTVGYEAFYMCTNLGDVIFENRTLPVFAEGVFKNSGANIYYLPETTNPEVLTNINIEASTVNKMEITSIGIYSGPTKTTYIEEENFDPTGLILTLNYDNGKSEDITYNDSTKGNFSFDKTKRTVIRYDYCK